MVPLYAARVQDLGIGDFVVIKCGACGHTAEIPPSRLIRGLGLKPTEKGPLQGFGRNSHRSPPHG